MRWRYSPQVYVNPGQVREVLEDRKLPPDVRRKAWQYPPLPGAGGPIQPGGAPAGQEYPPHLFPPANAYHIHLPLNTTPQAIPVGGSLVSAIWPAIPLGAWAVVRELGMSTSSFIDTRLTTRVNLAPVQPYPGVVGPVGELEEPHEIGIILKPGDVFSVLVENLGVAAITVAVRTYGWLWY